MFMRIMTNGGHASGGTIGGATWGQSSNTGPAEAHAGVLARRIIEDPIASVVGGDNRNTLNMGGATTKTLNKKDDTGAK